VVQVPWKGAPERVTAPWRPCTLNISGRVNESDCLGMQSKMGGTSHLKLNNGKRPIANKYREGKMKSTLKRELNST
jgi:hypothetical protein